MPGEDELFQMELNLHPNEASGLLMMGNQELLEEHGWDLGFWACLDEGEIEDCIAAIGHRRGSPDEEGWEIERLRAGASDAAGKTEDAEAITRDESTGYVYIPKSGPASYARTTTRSTSKARPSGRAVPSFSGSVSPQQQKGARSW